MEDEIRAEEQQRSSVPVFDPDEFREYVDDFDITEEQKDELLRTLWSIALACVDLGFGVDALQLAIPALAEFSSQEESDQLTGNLRAKQFAEVANGSVSKKGE